jgi:hypothetical protein
MTNPNRIEMSERHGLNGLRRRRWLGWAGFGLAAAVVALAGWQLGARAVAPRREVALSYQTMSFDEMARAADVVVAGRVTAVSPTRWNQDSGEWWERTIVDGYGLQTVDSALPYYEITVAADRLLVDGLGLASAPDEPVVFTVVGTSPLDVPAADGVTVQLGGFGPGAVDAPVGGTVAVFARQTQLAWRDGTRRVLQPVGEPAGAIVRLGPPVEGGADADAATDRRASFADADRLAEAVAAARGGAAGE